MDDREQDCQTSCVTCIGVKTEADYPETLEAVSQKAEEYIKSQGYDFSTWGPEVEFFVFDKVHWDVLTPYKGQSYSIESKGSSMESSQEMDILWDCRKATIQVHSSRYSYTLQK